VAGKLAEGGKTDFEHCHALPLIDGLCTLKPIDPSCIFYFPNPDGFFNQIAALMMHGLTFDGPEFFFWPDPLIAHYAFHVDHLPF
jgi:hypothetical protein